MAPSGWSSHHHHHQHHHSTVRNISGYTLILSLAHQPPPKNNLFLLKVADVETLSCPSRLPHAPCVSTYLFIVTDFTNGFRSSGHWMMAVFCVNLLNRILGTVVGSKGLPLFYFLFFEERVKTVHFELERKIAVK